MQRNLARPEKRDLTVDRQRRRVGRWGVHFQKGDRHLDVFAAVDGHVQAFPVTTGVSDIPPHSVQEPS
ncbi:hypothetical protein D3C86_2132880 [compost metagenome]